MGRAEAQVAKNDASVILCDLVAERENSSQQENMQKRAVLSGRLSFVHTVYPILKVHSTDFFSNIFFFQSPLARGDEEVPRMALRVLRPKSPHSEE